MEYKYYSAKFMYAFYMHHMPGVPRELAEHSLHVNPNARPVKQGLRKFHDDRRKSRS